MKCLVNIDCPERSVITEGSSKSVNEITSQAQTNSIRFCFFYRPGNSSLIHTTSKCLPGENYQYVLLQDLPNKPCLYQLSRPYQLVVRFLFLILHQNRSKGWDKGFSEFIYPPRISFGVIWERRGPITGFLTKPCEPWLLSSNQLTNFMHFQKHYSNNLPCICRNKTARLIPLYYFYHEYHTGFLI